ncbi:MAG TPA: protein kinase [Thermoanaerobaculia bacterium]|nr:protein kinase [Thermoanaerobaculia bacterium]
MDRERWRRIDEIFAEALQQPDVERARFIDQACGADSWLHSEVESLLAHHRNDDFLETPAAAWAMAGSAGTEPATPVGERLGRFEVLEKLGAGGMGEIYLAHDPKLERRVALKLLPAHFAADPERVRRFRREALTLSALNHPNILTVYEVVEVGGQELLVSELIQGVTLREVLRRGPPPVATALDVAAQVARALEAAHRVGIVHRDVNPGNVMIRADGLVKLLDFGIAKAARGGEAAEGGHGSPAVRTQTGMILGTVAYLSPEQARGDATGNRADIWALGCVLYEMLTARQAFPGATESDVLAAILTRDPDWGELPAHTPYLVRRLVRRCLEKNPNRRVHDVTDVRLEIEEAAADPLAAPAREPRARPWMPWAATGLAIPLAVALGVTAPWKSPSAPTPALRFELPHPTGGSFHTSVEAATLALSPDGSRLGFITPDPLGAATTIWIRPLAELEAHGVLGTEEAISLFWSPDGGSLGFVADGKLKRMPADGGVPVVVCSVEPGSGVSGTWGRDQILFASIQGDAIYRVAASGGTPAPALRPDPGRDEVRVLWPWFLPDGERFLYLALHSDGTSELRLAGPRGLSRSVAPLSSRFELVDPGFLVFVRDEALIAQRFDPRRVALVGSPLSLAPAVRWLGATGAAAFATARSGTVALATRSDLVRITRLDGAGRPTGGIGDAFRGLSVSLSPDGRRALVDRLRAGLASYDIWVVDLDRGVATRVTDQPGTEHHPRWLSDGTAILYSATKGGSPNLVRRDLASDSETKPVPSGPHQIAVGLTPDRRLFYRQKTPDGFELLAIPVESGGAPAGKPVQVLRPDIEDAALSPDGRLLAFVRGEDGRPQLFLRQVDGGEAIRVSRSGAETASFGTNGETIYFTTSDGWLAAVPVTAAPVLQVGAPERRFELPPLGWEDFEVLPDGGFLALVRATDGTKAPLTVITGWNQ